MTPGTEVPEAWVSSSMDEGEKLAAQDLAVWWTLFEDEALTTLVQQSLDANLDLATAAARVEEAMAERGIAAGERVPSVNGNGGLFETRLNDASGGVDGSREFRFSSVGLDASWELDVWGRIRNTVEAADAAAQASVEDFRGVRASIAAQVVTSYVSLRELQLRENLAKENIARQQETLELTLGRFDAGLVPKLDVNQAKLNLARTEAVLPLLRQRQAETLRALEILAGRVPGELAETLAAAAEVPAPDVANLRDLPANVIRRRPDLRAAEDQVLAAAARVGVAKAELLPRISLSGSFAWEARNGNDLFSGDSLGYSFGPSILMPLFQGGRLRSQVSAAEARAVQAELSYRQQVLEALGEVENALKAYQEELIRSQRLAEGVEAAQSTVVQVRSLYENGLVTFLNVLDAERNLAAVEDEAAASLGQTSRNLASVYRAFGGGWDAPEFEPLPQTKDLSAARVLSTQTAIVSLIDSSDDAWTVQVESIESFYRKDPAASDMEFRIELSKVGTDGESTAVLNGLLPGERVRVSWQEIEQNQGRKSSRETIATSAERISVNAK